MNLQKAFGFLGIIAWSLSLIWVGYSMPYWPEFLVSQNCNIHDTGEYNIDGTHIEMVENIDGKTEGKINMYNKKIYIESGHTYEKTKMICNHEILHKYFDYYHKKNKTNWKRNDPIYKLDSYLETPTCTKLMKKID